jgi:asparagine synthase (glutamine-hydrolysing)
VCGIAGIIDLRDGGIAPDLLTGMTHVMLHRGPDDRGYVLFSRKELEGWDPIPLSSLDQPMKAECFSLGLGHRRLSIIDLSAAGHQPMASQDGILWIIHNGEVYNYIEIRDELKGKGYRFRSNTDTEVILSAYAEWGEQCLDRFNGMWAFAIWDGRRNRLFCARDRLGIKPFYYFCDGLKFLFASEIKAILEDRSIPRRPNHQIVMDYLIHGFMDHTEETFFQGVRQLPPAHYVMLEREGCGGWSLKVTRWWDLDIQGRGENTSVGDEEYADRFYELLEDSIRLRLRRDVPIGSCLSGGLDSSSIVCLANKLIFDDGLIEKSLVGERQKTFSSCFEETAYDEREFIEEVVAHTGVDANYTFPRGEDLFDELQRIVWHQDEPFGSTSVFAQWHVMKVAAERRVRVLLDGQGGDELLGGYHLYFFPYFADLIKSLRLKRLLEELDGYAKYHGYSAYSGLKYGISLLMPSRIKGLIKFLLGKGVPPWVAREFARFNRDLKHPPDRFRSLMDRYGYHVLTKGTLPSLLRYEDRNSMANSIEARVPFLDYRLVEFLFSLPPSQKLRQGTTKVILRNSMKGILPEKVRARTDKMGFVTPEGLWFRTVAKGRAWEILTSKSFEERGYFNVKEIRKAFEEHITGRRDLGFTPWRWINLELWMRQFKVTS